VPLAFGRRSSQAASTTAGAAGIWSPQFQIFADVILTASSRSATASLARSHGHILCHPQR